jgi:hypothetical protein
MEKPNVSQCRQNWQKISSCFALRSTKKKPFTIFQEKGFSLSIGGHSPHTLLLRKHGCKTQPSPKGAKDCLCYTFSTISQTPQGQMPAQKPQPMHFDSSTTYSKDLFGSFFLVIAP